MSPKETAELIGTLKIFWPNHPTPDMDKTVAAWVMVIGDIPYPDMQTAVKNYMRRGSPFFPMPAQLIAMIAENAYRDLIPEACWAEVRDQARNVGYGRLPIFRNGEFQPVPEPVFSHALIADAVKGVGWKAICQAEDQQEMQKSFFFTLKALKDRALTESKLAPMNETPMPALDMPTNVRAIRQGRSA